MSIRTGRFSVKLLASIAALSLMGSGVAIADDSDVGTNVVPDTTLRKCINRTLDRGSSDAALTTADLSQVTGELSCTGDVATLEGVQYLRNVEVLDFYNLYAGDVSALSKFVKNKNKVTKLYYPMSPVTTVPDLSALQELTYFNFTNVNYLSLFAKSKTIRGEVLGDISGLANLTNLKTLVLDTNNISDISVLSSLPNLEVLDLKNNQISDISALASCLKLKDVDLSNNFISDIGPLGQLRYIQELNLSRNHIETIPVSFENLGDQVYSMSITYNKIKDFTNLPNARYLHIDSQVSKEAYRSTLEGAKWRNPAYFMVDAVYDEDKDVTTVDMRSFRDSNGKYATKVCKAEKYEESNNSGYNFRISDCGELLEDGQYAQFTGEFVTGQYFGYYFSNSLIGIVEIERVPSFSEIQVSDIALSGSSSVAVGQSVKLTASVGPANATDKGVVWKSSNPKVATVDANGRVTTKNPGTATITATAKDGSGVKASKTITVTEALQAVYRLYNPVTSEHLFTTDVNEYRVLAARHGWKQEGTAWVAPKSSKAPVYRLYNKGLGDHHYTANKIEAEKLVRQYGWVYDNDGNPVFYSDTAQRVPVYREYNSGLKVGQHHYTASKEEWNALASRHGWKKEGIGWYAVKLR